jgi:hypothetical protein
MESNNYIRKENKIKGGRKRPAKKENLKWQPLVKNSYNNKQNKIIKNK